MSINRIAGTLFVKYTQDGTDAKQLAVRGSWTISVDMFEREGIAGLDGVHGYSHKPRVPFMEGEVSLDASFSTDELSAICDATITAEMANGKTYLLRNAWTASARELDADEGKATVRFEGMSGEEMT